MTEPCIFVIFGATGNLAQNKLLPALYHLEDAGRLPKGITIVGFGRRDWDSEAWRNEVAQLLGSRVRRGLDNAVFEQFRQRLHFFQGDLDDPQAYRRLGEFLGKAPFSSENIAFYMAIRPAEFGAVSQYLADAGLHREEDGWRRLVIEKPFGYDMESAERLDEHLHRNFSEGQIFRIDH
ncbi:MAG: glucose-6-phosphate dehydrogenase, partial [Gammaproteobacteria bacterium]